MPYYTTCERCGSNLDPGEKCDCEKQENTVRKYKKKSRPATTGTANRKNVINILYGKYNIGK